MPRKQLLYMDELRHATWLELFFDLIFVVALGKLTAYYVNRPEYRPYLWLNTLSMFAIVGFSLLLPQPQYILLGAALSKLVYIAMNYRTQLKLYRHAHL